MEEKQLVVIMNNQAVTDSMTVAEYFGKNHRDVLEAIRNIISQTESMRNFPQTPMFVESTRVNEQNKQSYPYFVMNRDGFTLLAMGFTGKKAMEFKLKYIAAFNRMEAILKEQQSKPMTTVQMFSLAAKALEEHDQLLAVHTSQISSVKETINKVQENIRSLTDAHNGMKSNSQQQQLDKHEVQINELQQQAKDILSVKDDLGPDIKRCVDLLCHHWKQYYNLGSKEGRVKASTDLCRDISEAAGKSPTYIESLRSSRRKRLIDQGLAETTAKQKVNATTIINSDPLLRNAAIGVMTTVFDNFNKGNYDVKGDDT